jgi:hypothetical protein
VLSRRRLARVGDDWPVDGAAGPRGSTVGGSFCARIDSLPALSQARSCHIPRSANPKRCIETKVSDLHEWRHDCPAVDRKITPPSRSQMKQSISLPLSLISITTFSTDASQSMAASFFVMHAASNSAQMFCRSGPGFSWLYARFPCMVLIL